jgi:hypothetical protein
MRAITKDSDEQPDGRQIWGRGGKGSRTSLPAPGLSSRNFYIDSSWYLSEP